MDNEQVKRITDKYFGKQDVEVIRKIGFQKMASTFTWIYNNVCRPCQLRVIRNPKISLDKYCEACQRKVKPILEELKKDLEEASEQ